ncbi:MAG: Rne/Rng family ribonuclease [Gammaproteobacteria bacterium]|nr:Rne/Rng family ribonuclease [Gammaproteobacteria bacterium]
MKRMLINATQPEELRLAMVDGQKLFDLDIEVPTRDQKKRSNVYKARITRIEPSLDAAFVEFGAERQGFLPLKEISRSYFKEQPQARQKLNIKDALEQGQELIVQVEKEERGTKGAALTTFVSLAGRFLVLMPNNPRAGGVSRRIIGEERDELRDVMSDLEVPKGMGAIARTAGVGRSTEELQWDLDYLLSIWKAIETAAEEKSAPFLIYQERNFIIRALRDYLSSDVGEILIDDPDSYEEAKQFMEAVMPHNLKKLKLHDESTPLFTRFQIESQIESAFKHTVHLPSGGSVVIDPTEALVSIDINSARATRGDDIESTALQTNLEAADEIGRQLRIRDIGGLIVIDFIDMGPVKNQREVEDRLRAAVRIDRARVQIGRISRFGLMEMSRQRLRPSLGESSYEICPRCSGRGNIRDIESLALAVLRLMGEESRKERTARIIAQLPVDVGTYLLNEKRDWVNHVERRSNVQVMIVPNPNLERPNYKIDRVRDDEIGHPDFRGSSYQLATEEPAETTIRSDAMTPAAAPEQPAVQAIAPATPAPATKKSVARTSDQPGWWRRLWQGIFGGGKQPARKPNHRRQTKHAARHPHNRRKSSQRRQGQQRGQKRGGHQRGQQQNSRGNQGRKRSSSQNRQQGQQQGKKTQAKSGQKTGGRRPGPKKKTQGRNNNQNNNQKSAPSNNNDSSNDNKESGNRRPQQNRRRRSPRGPRHNNQSDADKKNDQTPSSAASTQPKDDQKPKKPAAENGKVSSIDTSTKTDVKTNQDTTTTEKFQSGLSSAPATGSAAKVWSNNASESRPRGRDD